MNSACSHPRHICGLFRPVLFFLSAAFTLAQVALFLPAGAASAAIEIKTPFELPRALMPAGREHKSFGDWASFIRGDRFNFYTNVKGSGCTASLVFSIQKGGNTNVRVAIRSDRQISPTCPARSPVEIRAGDRTMQLTSANTLKKLPDGYQYFYNLVSSSKSAVQDLVKMLLEAESASFVPGKNDFIADFPLRGFREAAEEADKWRRQGAARGK